MRKLKDNPLIKVVDYPDAICNSCPYNINNRCVKKGPDFESEVREKDNTVIKHLRIKLNEEVMADDARSLIDTKLDKVKEICKKCEWKKYCNICKPAQKRAGVC